MKPKNKRRIFTSLFFVTLMFFSVQTALAQCEPADQAALDDCVSQCDPGDQGCIDSCCYDWPDCECPQPEEEACPPAEQAALDDCVSQCDPGDQGCIDSCCYDWPDCECPQPEEEACPPADQAALDDCVSQCDPGNQGCIDSCCYDWPDCECPQPEEEACPPADQAALDDCVSQCDPGDQGCIDSCCYDWPDCECPQPEPDEYLNCYDSCFATYQNHDDLINCIEQCQQENPGDWDQPYELTEPRCFAETNFFDYEDVPPQSWFWAPINFLTRLEIQEGAGEGINSDTFHSRIVRGYNRDDEDDSKLKPGYTKDIFKPARNLNRFEASKIATLVSCYTIPDNQSDISKPKVFSDVNPDSNEYANRVIYRAAEVGLFDGYEDGSFGPYNDITRAEFLKVFLTVGEFDVESQNYQTSGFTDVNQDDWYYPWVAYANHNSIPIIGGYDDGTFRPNEPIRRSEAMKIVTNTMHALGWINQ
jgi:hypothetical protein